MAELNHYHKAAATKRRNTRNALVSVADGLLADTDYSAIKAGDIYRRAGISSAAFYSAFSGKGDWAAAILNQRLNEALDRQAAPSDGQPRTSHAWLTGQLSLLGEVSAPLPGITKGLVDERTHAQREYSDLLPKYYDVLIQTIADGQEQGEFNIEVPPSALGNFALDSLTLAYAVHLDNSAARSTSMSLVLASVRSTE